MSDQRHPPIAKEGWIHILLAGSVAVLATFTVGWSSCFFWIIFLFFLQFFRDPAKKIPHNDGGVVSPADGRIVSVSKSLAPDNKTDALKISVFMNVFNIHSNRSPVDGLVREVIYRAGGFLNASLDKASDDNEKNVLIIETDSGKLVYCVQIAGLIARRILCYARQGDRLDQGQRYGFIRFGSRVDLYLPPTAAPSVAIGDKVSAGETIVAVMNPDLGTSPN